MEWKNLEGEKGKREGKEERKKRGCEKVGGEEKKLKNFFLFFCWVFGL